MYLFGKVDIAADTESASGSIHVVYTSSAQKSKVEPTGVEDWMSSSQHRVLYCS